MLNSLWLNAQGLNGDGTLQRVIPLHASVTAGATASQPAVTRQVGLGGKVQAGAASAAPAVTMRVRMAGIATAGARVPPVRVTATRAFAGRGYVLASGMLYVSAEVPLFGTGSAGAQAVLYPFDKLFHGQVTAGASATAELVRIRRLGGVASTHTTVASAPTNFIRQGFARVSAGVSDAIGNPDTTVGGVRHAELGTRSRAGVMAEVTIDPKKALYGTGQIHVRALPAKAPSRTIMLKSTGNLVLSAAKATLHADVTLQGVPVRAGAVAAHAPLYRTTFLSAHATAGAEGQGQVGALRYLGGRGTGGADAKADPIRMRGLQVQVQAGASAAHAKVKTAEKLAGRASVHVDAAAPGYFTTRTMHAQPTMVTCTAQPGDIKVNLYAREPDYRTLIVEPGDWTTIVEPQPFGLAVLSDTRTAIQYISGRDYEWIPDGALVTSSGDFLVTFNGDFLVV